MRVARPETPIIPESPLLKSPRRRAASTVKCIFHLFFVIQLSPSADRVASSFPQGIPRRTSHRFVTHLHLIVDDGDASPSTPGPLWKRRHARSITEGIRNEKTPMLNSILNGVHIDEKRRHGKRGGKYVARTIAGLIMALAEEAQGLEVEVSFRGDTPYWHKSVDEVKINFKRLGFKPLHIGGIDKAIRNIMRNSTVSNEGDTSVTEKSGVATMEAVFRRIDVDNSGALDEEELVEALEMAMDDQGTLIKAQKKSEKKSHARRIPREALKALASRLVRLYDTNGDNELDREEYQTMVEDMAALRKNKVNGQGQAKVVTRINGQGKKDKKSRGPMQIIYETILQRISGNEADAPQDLQHNITLTNTSSQVGILNEQQFTPSTDALTTSQVLTNGASINSTKTNYINTYPNNTVVDISDNHDVLKSLTGEGSIVFKDLKLDLRRLIFGAVPVLKKITPGGPLVLEPFTTIMTGSFSREDIMNSNLVDAGLRSLVARALNRRVRSWRDLVDGTVWYGRTWKMGGKGAPTIQVPKLTNVEFDDNEKIIISGRALLQASPNAPIISNAFKLRTKLGTRMDGQVLRLKEPELALVVECPKAWERGFVQICKRLNVKSPTKPKPIYTYFPLVSPLAATDKDGFNLGDDNCIQSICIRDRKLHFEMSAVLRPGRFLGNHYIAITFPIRTFIITMDRVREGIQAARKDKRAADLAAKEARLSLKYNQTSTHQRVAIIAPAKYHVATSFKEDSLVDPEDKEIFSMPPPPTKNSDSSFFSRFVQGYLGAALEEKDTERSSRLMSAVSEWFGRQDESDDDNDNVDYKDKS